MNGPLSMLGDAGGTGCHGARFPVQGGCNSRDVCVSVWVFNVIGHLVSWLAIVYKGSISHMVRLCIVSSIS